MAHTLPRINSSQRSITVTQLSRCRPPLGLHRCGFAAVFGSGYLGTLASADLTGLGETSFSDADPDGIPDAP